MSCNNLTLPIVCLFNSLYDGLWVLTGTRMKNVNLGLLNNVFTRIKKEGKGKSIHISVLDAKNERQRQGVSRMW